jgi:HK97 family phage prohead protease
MTQPLVERRSSILEVRARGRRLEGYAALFGVEAQLGPVTETIERGAFRDTLARRADVVALQDHDASRLLGRTASGSLQLAEDDKGLQFRLQLPETQAGNDVLVLAQRGDLGGASFGFRVGPKGQRWEGEKRVLTAIDLVEISIISSWPAYPETGNTISARNASPPVRLALARARLRLAEAGG